MLSIIQGEDKTFTAFFRKKNGQPFDLTGATEITFCLAGSSALVNVTLGAAEVSIVSATLGEVSVTVDDTKTAALRIGEDQTYEAMIDKGTDRTIIQFIEELTVVASICNP